MTRACRWLAWIVGVPVVAFALLAAAAWWTVHQREARFARLPPGERQLAIYDAFAQQVESNYYDQDFLERGWPALRDEWRAKAAKSHDDFDVYFNVLMQLSLNFPTSHVSARPPEEHPPVSRKGGGAGEKPLAAPGRTGITIALVRRGKGMLGVVDTVTPGSPAARAGVEPGWTLVSYNSCRVGAQASSQFFGIGTPQERIQLESTGQLRWHDAGITPGDLEARYRKSVTYTCDAEATRAPFDVRVIGGVTYVRLDTFRDPPLVDQAMAALDRAGERGVILDLRANGGGLRDEAMRFASRLLPAGTLVGTEIRRGVRTELRTSASAIARTWPLAVLIGPSSASAAEVSAAALQDHHRAVLVGRPTAGATLVSGNFDLPDGGSVQIAMSDFLRPGGGRIEAVGVMPDVAIMPTIEDVRAGRDPALERALLELREPRTTVATGSPSPAG